MLFCSWSIALTDFGTLQLVLYTLADSVKQWYVGDVNMGLTTIIAFVGIAIKSSSASQSFSFIAVDLFIIASNYFVLKSHRNH